MHLNRSLQCLALLAVLSCGGALAGQTLYCATGSNGVDGQLFTVNSATGAATPVGDILIGANPISVTGLAVHPTSGVLFGVTANSSPNDPRSLVTINPATGAATLVGSLGSDAVPDIAFDSAGTLFGWAGGGAGGIHDLVTINQSTGAVTPVGDSGATSTTGGGLALDSADTCFSSNSGDSGTLDTLSTTTGALTAGPTLSAAPQGFAINSMSFSSTDVLFAVNTDGNNPAAAVLVTINTTTGAVATVGNLPDDTDALAWDNGAPAAPEMNVTRGAAIADGGTDALGNRTVGQGATLTYTITNAGTADLTITTPVTIGGETNCTVNVTSQPGNTVVTAGNTTLILSVTPTTAGAFSFTVSIDNDDADENPYNWTASGTGTVPSDDDDDDEKDDEGCSTGESRSLLLLAGLIAAAAVVIRLRRSRA